LGENPSSFLGPSERLFYFSYCSPFLVPRVLGICKVTTRSAPYGWKACIQRGAAWCPVWIVLDTGYLPPQCHAALGKMPHTLA
jgi:hypothetical protein